MSRTAVSNKEKVVKKITKDLILIENFLISIPNEDNKTSKESVATIASNLAYYGFTLSKEAYKALMKVGDSKLKAWWKNIEENLKEVTGENRKMGDFVVYKNFPEEVLNMSDAEYWFNQICMYIGFPNEFFTEDEKKRKPMIDKLKAKVLHLANEDSLFNILNSLCSLPTKWNNDQLRTVTYLVTKENMYADYSKIPFKENMVNLVTIVIDEEVPVRIKSATDVLRLGVGLSGGDVSLKTNTKFKSFSKKQRKFLLNLLENSTNLEEDLARNSGKFKKFLRMLHPGDFKNKFPRVVKANGFLYHDELTTFNSKVETLLTKKNVKVLELLQTRPGEFSRRLFKTISLFGKPAAKAYSEVLDKLTVYQLLKMERLIMSVNERFYRTIAPKGNWTKLQILENKTNISDELRMFLSDKISETLKEKLSGKLNGPVKLDPATNMIKLQDNSAELAQYGRGTSFPIPENIKFIRSASYWSDKSGGNSWFDNGWNFFDENWKALGSCCWDVNTFGYKSAVFSGDPTNSKDIEGRVCQMIDLYLDKLAERGVRYAVWNILCYSRRSFNVAKEVYAALQWGEDAQKGKLFEPKRAQLNFLLKGDNLTKYIAYIDVKERKLVYIDANLKGSVRSAKDNEQNLQNVMPAFVEYLDTLPSVFDLFAHAKQSKKGTVITYDDSNVELKDKEVAYVFRPSNDKNSFEQMDLSGLLS